MQFLVNMARMTRELMVLESEMLIEPRYDEHAWFIEHGYCGDGSNWWLYGPTCVSEWFVPRVSLEQSSRALSGSRPPGRRRRKGFPARAVASRCAGSRALLLRLRW